jgi:RHH-type proline utilization regulon transcriptional repressor/proline dehydrogenase/delta 1-pyrroline-5-carboxylate dehydrogenase
VTAAQNSGGIDAFLATYDLSSREGVVLMCLAEALLRIPDAATVDRLIRDKIGNTEWEKRLGSLAQHLCQRRHLGADAHRPHRQSRQRRPQPARHLEAPRRARRRTGDPAGGDHRHAHSRQAVRHGAQHSRSAGPRRSAEKAGYRHSYDMLGESARSERRRAALLRVLPRGDPGDRRRRRRPPGVRSAVDLDQALGAAPAL